jgi:hypothetical protein
MAYSRRFTVYPKSNCISKLEKYIAFEMNRQILNRKEIQPTPSLDETPKRGSKAGEFRPSFHVLHTGCIKTFLMF